MPGNHQPNRPTPAAPSDGVRTLTALPAASLVLLVRLYQITLSPLLGGHCRFQPTCSQYALEALREHGAVRGSALAARRVLRCHPWGGSGWDPPPRRDRA